MCVLLLQQVRLLAILALDADMQRHVGSYNWQQTNKVFLFDMTLMAILFFFALTQTEIDHKHIHKQAEKKHAMPPLPLLPLAPCPPSLPYRDTFVWGHIHIRTH